MSHKSIIPKNLQEEKSSAKRKRNDTDNDTDVPRIVKDRQHMLADEYLGIVGELMYPKTTLGPFGFAPEEGRLPLNRVTSLGYLLHPMRRSSVFERWSPLEIAIFESSLTLFGKNFHLVQKKVKSKSVKEIIEFYYEWKKTSHYKEWKKTYVPDERDTPTVLVDN